MKRERLEEFLTRSDDTSVETLDSAIDLLMTLAVMGMNDALESHQALRPIAEVLL